MLLFIAFMCFAVLLAAWLIMPEKSDAPVAKPVEKMSPESGTLPARA